MTQSVAGINEDIHFDCMVRSVCETAVRGLNDYYAGGNDSLPYSATIAANGKLELSGFSLRYAAISQIGITRWLRFHPEDASLLPDLWPRIVDNKDAAVHIGDYALALWAGLESKADNCGLFAKLLSESWPNRADSCNAVELGWIVQACVLAQHPFGVFGGASPTLQLHLVLDEAKTRLVRLFRPGQNLFQRHNRPGIGGSISRRIACFADQVYPILALANYGKAYGDRQCIEFAAAATERICRFQGPLGQWWWHYDTRDGRICEEYPVFSVHQDAMAPMAILASDRAVGADHRREIELGLLWLFGHNELKQNLVLSKAGIIWRDIEKREIGRLSRSLRAALCTAGLRSLHRLAGKCFVGFRVNHECRPYHLGWILYAWADFGGRAKRASEVS
jgi:hypothetical protein